MTVTYHVGDTRKVIAGIPDGSVDLIATSPPFLALRSYVPADHEHKADEIGSERNPAEFIDMLLGLTAEWGRVLAPHGSIAIELGDTYSGSGGGGGDYLPGGLREGQQGNELTAREHNAANWRQKNATPDAWPRAKSLALVPQLYAIALAYGINPLTGQPSPAGRWLVRNVIVWHRPNPAVGALGDKVRPSTSYIVIATRSTKRWFDLTAVRTEVKDYGPRFSTYERTPPGQTHRATKIANDGGSRVMANAAGAPPLDCWLDEYDGSHDTWTLTTQPSRLAHYAMWPAKLAERLTLMMCPLAVCRVCGEPRRRIEGTVAYVNARSGKVVDRASWVDGGERLTQGGIGRDNGSLRSVTTEGWTDCECSCERCGGTTRLYCDDGLGDECCPHPCDCDDGRASFRPGHVLDPFAGSGTTLAVADLHGRDATGIDFDQRNHDLYPARHAEVKRALYGTVPEMVGQQDLFGEVVA